MVSEEARKRAQLEEVNKILVNELDELKKRLDIETEVTSALKKKLMALSVQNNRVRARAASLSRSAPPTLTPGIIVPSKWVTNHAQLSWVHESSHTVSAQR